LYEMISVCIHTYIHIYVCMQLLSVTQAWRIQGAAPALRSPPYPLVCVCVCVRARVCSLSLSLSLSMCVCVCVFLCLSLSRSHARAFSEFLAVSVFVAECTSECAMMCPRVSSYEDTRRTHTRTHIRTSIRMPRKGDKEDICSRLMSSSPPGGRRTVHFW